MITLAIIAIVAGTIILAMSLNMKEKDKTLIKAGVILLMGGMIGGCFATPSRDMPNGMPGAAAISIIFIIIGAFILIRKFILKKNPEQEKEDNKKGLKIAFGAMCVVFIILVAIAFISDQNSKPWKKLGVSESEYKKVYNHYKYGTPIR